MKYVYISILLIYCFVVFGQPSALNQFNGSGKRQGKWLIYIDKNWKEVKDTNLYVYKFYDEYLNGKPLIGIGKIKHNERLEEPTENEDKFLNGEYKWIKKNNTLLEKHFFRNGELVNSQYYKKNNVVEYYIDYTITYENNPYTYGMYYYMKNGLSPFFIFKNGTRGWANYEWEETDPKITSNPK